MNDELRPEYDLSELLQGGERGKYAGRYRQGTNLVLLAPDVAEVFTDEESVNEALHPPESAKRHLCDKDREYAAEVAQCLPALSPPDPFERPPIRRQ